MGNQTVRAWQLGRTLAGHRKKAGITQKRAAELIECSQSRIAQIEDGKLQIKKIELDYLLRAYNIDVADIAALEQTRIDVEHGEQGWWGGLPDPVNTYVGLEQAAKRVRTVEIELIPGLLQTEGYARDLHVLRGDMTDEQVDDKVRTRMRRQERLTALAKPLEVEAVISWSAFVWCREPGDAVGAAQLRHLHERAQLPNVDVRILVPSRGRHSGMQGAYSLVDFTGGLPEVAWYEHAYGGRVIDATSVITGLATLFTKIQTQALDRDASLALLADLVS